MGEIIEVNFGKGPLNWPDEPTQAQVEQITNLFEDHAKNEGFHPVKTLESGLIIGQFLIGQEMDPEKMKKYTELIKAEINKRYPVGKQVDLAM